MGFTYNGHPTSCAVALANLDIIEREGLLARASQTGAYILGRLQELLELPVVGEVRGFGMMHAVELVSSQTTRAPLPVGSAPHEVIRRDEGVIVRISDHNLVITPPLIMSHDEADEVVAAIRSVTERLQPSGEILPKTQGARPRPG